MAHTVTPTSPSNFTNAQPLAPRRGGLGLIWWILCPLGAAAVTCIGTMLLGIIIIIAAASSSTGGAWRGSGEIAIDWDKMPQGAVGEQNLFSSAFMRGVLANEERLKNASLEHSSLVASRALTVQQLAAKLSVSTHSSGRRQTIRISSNGSSEAEALTIVKEAQREVASLFTGYRLLEGLGTRVYDIDRAQRDSRFTEEEQATRLFKMTFTQPITATTPSARHVAVAFILPLLLVSAFLAFLAMGAGLLLVWMVSATRMRRLATSAVH